MGEAQNEPEVEETENGQGGDSNGLNADGFVRVCLQLMRDNFLAKVGSMHSKAAASCSKVASRGRTQ